MIKYLFYNFQEIPSIVEYIDITIAPSFEVLRKHLRMKNSAYGSISTLYIKSILKCKFIS